MAVAQADRRFIFTGTGGTKTGLIDITDIICINESGAAISAAAPVVIDDKDDALITKFLTLANDGVEHRTYGVNGNQVDGITVVQPDGTTTIVCYR